MCRFEGLQLVSSHGRAEKQRSAVLIWYLGNWLIKLCTPTCIESSFQWRRGLYRMSCFPRVLDLSDLFGLPSFPRYSSSGICNLWYCIHYGTHCCGVSTDSYSARPHFLIGSCYANYRCCCLAASTASIFCSSLAERSSDLPCCNWSVSDSCGDNSSATTHVCFGVRSTDVAYGYWFMGPSFISVS